MSHYYCQLCGAGGFLTYRAALLCCRYKKHCKKHTLESN